MADGFLSRWARQKTLVDKIDAQVAEAKAKAKANAQTEAGARPAPVVSAAATGSVAESPNESQAAGQSATTRQAEAGQLGVGGDPADQNGSKELLPGLRLPTIEDAKNLPIGADVSDYMRPGVSSEARATALRRLFADPRYNVISELNDYIADYANMPSLPKEDLHKYSHLEGLFLFEDPPWKKELEREKAEKEKAAQERAALGLPDPPVNIDGDANAPSPSEASQDRGVGEAQLTQIMPPTKTFPTTNDTPVPTRRYTPTVRKEST